MPRLERLQCVVCQGNIDSPRKQLAVNGLWKVFLLARSLKQINSDDAGCIDCRMKYLNWLKKIDGDFDHYDENSQSSVYGIGFVSIFCNNNYVRFDKYAF